MLNIITSWSPDDLANDMLGKIRNCWTNPFVAPVIVFADTKTEQWFNLYVLEKQGVCMNLNSTRLEYFLFNALKTDNKQSLLYPDLLRDFIIQKLLSEKNGRMYLDTIKNNDNIADYLNISVDTKNLNYRHLFDFANDLSELFTEYEATRENIDDAVAGTDWQKDLYKDVIDNDEIILNGIHYYTCPEIAKKNRAEHNGKIVFNVPDNQNVFIFGFSGMGQTYRNLLKEYGEQSDIYVFLQTSDNRDDNDNIFIKHWGQFGRTNHKLFNPTKHTSVTNLAAYNQNSTLGNIQKNIAQNNNNFCTDVNVCDDTLTITAAPSKIKELEIVHSQICKLLKDKQKNVNLKDILVLAPDISQYKSAIETVFNQTDENNDEYPFIPICTVDYSGKNSNVLDILQTLYYILHDGGFSRSTFFALIKNFIIQNKYKISDSDANDTFLTWVDKMQVYRTRTINDANGTENTDDDWENAVKRLLVAKLTDTTEPVNINSGEIMPFSDLSTTDNELLAKFISVISDIKNEWVQVFATKNVLTAQYIEKIQNFLKNLFAPDFMSPKEIFVFDKINLKLEQYIKQCQESHTTIPTECVLLSLIHNAGHIRFNTGTVFTRGVTFTSLLPNRILPAKYVFLIGMSSENFPGVNQKISLDRRFIIPANGDDDIPSKNKNAFLCQLMASGNELHISFVDKDLQTDNTFYPSYVLDVLTQYTKITINYVGIDENRDWDDLYTQREWRNKQVRMDLGKSPNITTTKNISNTNNKKDLPDVVTLEKMQYFLENPLKFYSIRMFGFEEDDKSTQDLEDVTLNGPAQNKLKKMLLKPLLENMKNPQEKEKTEDLQMAYYRHTGVLPREPFAQPEFNKVKEELEADIKKFDDYNKRFFPNRNIEIKSNYNLNLPVTFVTQGGAIKKYFIRGEIMLYAHDGNDVLLYAQKNAVKLFPDMYALVAQIAQQENQPDKEYLAHLVNINNKKTSKTNKKIQNPECTNDTNQGIKISARIATEKLNEFYRQMFQEECRTHIPFFDSNFFEITCNPITVLAKKTDTSFDKIKERFLDTQYNFYYIPHSDFFNADTDLGYTSKNFEPEFQNALEKHNKLLYSPKPQGTTDDR